MISFLVIEGNDFSVCEWEEITGSNIKETCELVQENNGTYVYDDDENYFEASIVSFDFDIDQKDEKTKQAFDDFLSYIKSDLCDYDQLKSKDVFLIEEE